MRERHVKYIILYDFGIHNQFFNTTLDYVQVAADDNLISRFDDPMSGRSGANTMGGKGSGYSVRFST